MSETLLDGRVLLHCGDCRAVLATLAPDSIDAVVTDPPYHLTSIVQRFGADDAAPAKSNGATGVYKRASAGFMGKVWDGGAVAFDPDTWRAVFRVLKPGGHLVACGGTRTYHRLACAIEDAGFEIRDTISWLYGSGFPKSHDVSKGIDRHGGKQVGWFGPWLKAWREANGIKQSDVAVLFPSKTGGKTGCVANWELGFNLPTPEQFNTICQRFGLPFETLEAAERAITAQINGTRLAVAPGQDNDRSQTLLDITAPATDAALQWQGWGTALKPACELIVLARKPLSEGTVAANVLRWGTGALNIDGCRVEGEVPAFDYFETGSKRGYDGGIKGGARTGEKRNGRWPANVAHDGSAEVTAAFPDASPSRIGDRVGGCEFFMGGDKRAEAVSGYGDTGSAARFFYTAKADVMDRIGSRHPTIKPLDLMQWLVRMVTPKGGTVLDPFAGTGTSGEAAWREGMRAVLIEAEAEYQADIRRRMALVLAGPDERVRESVKAKNLPRDDGPLFSDWQQMWAKPFDFSQEPT